MPSNPVASSVPYLAAVASHWSTPVPSDVAGALDRLAARTALLTARVWYVNGGAAAGGNGSFLLPFQTLGAALAVASAGDVIDIAAGTYVENNVLPNVDNLTIWGRGRGVTILKAAPGSLTPTIKWAPLSGSYTKLTFRDLTLQNLENGTVGTPDIGFCISLDGNGTAITISGDQVAQFLSTACIFDGVILDKGGTTGDGYLFRAVDKVYVANGNGTTIAGNPAGWNCSGTWFNTGYAFISATSLGNGATAFTYTYDYTIGVVKAANGRQGFNLLNGSSAYGTTTLTKCPLFGAASDTAFYGDIVATSLTMSSAPFRAPAIRIASTIGSAGVPASVAITSPAMTAPLVAGGAITYVDLTGARIWNSSTKTTTLSGTAGGVLRFNPIARTAVFDSVAEVTATVKVYAGAETDIDLKSSYARQATLGQVAASNGTIDRDRHSFKNLTSPSTTAITPPFPTGVDLSALVQVLSGTVTATVTATTLTLTGVGTANVTVTRNA